MARVFEYFWANAKSICLPGTRALQPVPDAIRETRLKDGQPVSISLPFSKATQQIPDIRYATSGMTFWTF
ncbi:hypothetical protein FNH22_24405 [Fulvivirga sp. M361]|uniref:hypothetical protein n=1 Tax=Fulvivirga sp. M361 TaxID=2594266 RepID=UPI00117B1B71|nr:hypothetical protein [Fulvivirga sp. M361]TRX51281.1 hypothetical protein FNH22_24405 [Fulvivirga sp. M361]